MQCFVSGLSLQPRCAACHTICDGAWEEGGTVLADVKSRGAPPCTYSRTPEHPFPKPRLTLLYVTYKTRGDFLTQEIVEACKRNMFF